MCNALTVTKRESAPLPERLCERITYSTAMFAIWVNFSDKFVQCEGADRHRRSTPEMQNILLQNAVGHAVRKAKNFAGGATDAIFSGRPALINYSCSLALRRWSSSRATVTSCPISSAALTPIFSTCASASSEETRGFSPLPSAWRRAISPRTAVITKAAIVSPSVFEFSISSITSWGKRIFFICDLLLMFPVAIRMSGYFEVCTHYTKRCVDKTLDTVAHLNLICIYTNDCGVYTATPRSARNTCRASNHQR